MKDNQLEAFSAVYVKGMARACCALVVADLLMTGSGVALPVGTDMGALAVPGTLASSLAVVHIRRGTMAMDRTTVALENAPPV